MKNEPIILFDTIKPKTVLMESIIKRGSFIVSPITNTDNPLYAEPTLPYHARPPLPEVKYEEIQPGSPVDEFKKRTHAGSNKIPKKKKRKK